MLLVEKFVLKQLKPIRKVFELNLNDVMWHTYRKCTCKPDDTVFAGRICWSIRQGVQTSQRGHIENGTAATALGFAQMVNGRVGGVNDADLHGTYLYKQYQKYT